MGNNVLIRGVKIKIDICTFEDSFGSNKSIFYLQLFIIRWQLLGQLPAMSSADSYFCFTQTLWRQIQSREYQNIHLNFPEIASIDHFHLINFFNFQIFKFSANKLNFNFKYEVLNLLTVQREFMKHL